jgi:hypothetical protein
MATAGDQIDADYPLVVFPCRRVRANAYENNGTETCEAHQQNQVRKDLGSQF